MAQRNSSTELRRALKASLKLQSHYAQLLNQYDGGQRMIFDSMDKWLARLREVDARTRLAAEHAGKDAARLPTDTPADLSGI
jgi:hypothetical protein